MIRIELIKKNGQLAKSIDFAGETFTVGRALDAQLIVPDFSIQAQELVIRKGQDGQYSAESGGRQQAISSEAVFELGSYRLHLINLAYFAAQPPASEKAKVAEWLWPIGLLLLVLVICTTGTLLLAVSKLEVRHDFEYLLSIALYYVGVGLPLIFISRTVNGEFQFWGIFKYLSVALLIAILISTPNSGVRWLPGRLFEKVNLWLFVNILLLLPVFWKLINLVFQQLGQKTRLLILSLPLLFFLVREVALYSTYQNKYFFELIQPRPVVFQVFESPAISLQEFNKRVEMQIGEASIVSHSP